MHAARGVAPSRSAVSPEPSVRPQIGSTFTRRRVNQVLVILELSRHPQTTSQIERVEEFARAFEIFGPDLEIVRRWADEGAERATEDYDRFYADRLPELSEPGLRETHLRLDDPDVELAAQLQALHDLPDDTLGYAYIEFYRRNNLVLPGAARRGHPRFRLPRRSTRPAARHLCPIANSRQRRQPARRGRCRRE